MSGLLLWRVYRRSLQCRIKIVLPGGVEVRFVETLA